MEKDFWKEISEEFETIMHFEYNAVVRLNQTQIATLLMLIDDANRDCSSWHKAEYKAIADKLISAYDEASAEHKKAVEHFKSYHPVELD